LLCIDILSCVKHNSTFSDKADTTCKLDVDIAKISSLNVGSCLSELNIKNDDVGRTWSNSICRRIVIDVVTRSILIDENY